MQKVLVRGLDGSEVELALVSYAETTAFVCRPEKYKDAMRGALEAGVVGFPIEDVRLLESGRPLGG
jgi:hypothetical protein